MTGPQIVVNGDTARTRRTDPLTSHLAGDRSQETISQVKAIVLELVAYHGPLSGSQLNDLFVLWTDPYEWHVHFDSPRKRAGELADEGLLVVTNADAKRGTERIYSLPSEEARAAA